MELNPGVRRLRAALTAVVWGTIGVQLHDASGVGDALGAALCPGGIRGVGSARTEEVTDARRWGLSVVLAAEVHRNGINRD